MQKNYKTFIFVIAIGFSFFSCQSDLDIKLLYGDWRGADWVREGKSNLNAEGMNFVFEPDGTYSANLGNQGEAGTYRLSGDKLYTTAEGKKEKVVKLLTLNRDTVRMDMNRSGQKEVLILIKK